MSNIGYSTLSVIPSARGFGAALTKGIAPEMALAGKASGATFAKGMLKSSAAVAAIFVGVGIASLKMGADFQESTTQLVTGAGESEKSIGMIREGLLAMAPAVGMGPTALAKAMFLVESAGFHGAAGLLVMKSAAEGARIGGADATVVANGLTTALTDYHLPASMAATVTSKLTATVAAGKTNMQGLTGSLSAVLPAAAAAGIGLDQVLGAVATMTGQGISADQATQNLANTIRSLQHPSEVVSKTMAAMGLNSTTVAQNLGKKGLTGTLAELTGAITKHMGPAGLVLQNVFNQSALAAQSADIMLKNLPPSIQKLAEGFAAGTVTQGEWMKATRKMPALQGSLAKQWAATEKQAHGFNDTLKAGGGPAKTYSAILADMLGGATGLNTGLALTGPNMGTFSKNVTDISKASAEANGHVKGWALTQQDFKVKMDQAKGSVSAMAVKIGTALIPSVQALLADGVQLSTWLGQHSTATWAIVGALGAFATAAIAVKVASLASATATGVWTAATGLGTAAMWLGTAALKIGWVETLALKAMYLGSAIATGVMTAAQWLLNAALTANPVGLVIVGIGLLVAAIIWVATKTTWFQTTWEYMSHGIAVAWQWLWNVVLAPIFRFVLDGVGSIIGGISNMLMALSHIPGFGWAKDAAISMRSASDQAHALANGITDIPNKVPVVVTFSGNFSWLGQQIASAQGRLNKLAAMGGGKPPGQSANGQTNWAGGPTWVGERGPEIVNLPRGAQVIPNHKIGAGVKDFDYDRMAAAMSRAQIILDGKNVARSVDQRLAPR